VQDKAKLYKVISRYFPIEKYHRSLVNLYRQANTIFRDHSVQRAKSFGKKNFKTLFEAIEREQAERGNL